MRVMCINDKPWDIPPGPSYGDVCTVIEEKKRFGGIYYIFQEYDKTLAFNSELFIPLTGDTAPEIEEEVEVEVAQPVLNLKPGTPILSHAQMLKRLQELIARSPKKPSELF